MAGINVDIHWKTRPAKFKRRFGDTELGLEPNVEYECDVFGLYQYSDGNESCPYFICELPNGKCLYVDPAHLQFTDKEEYAGGKPHVHDKH